MRPRHWRWRASSSAAGIIRYSERTFSARGPLGPWPTVKDTRWPSRKSSNRTPTQPDWWKKYSVPSAAAMNPKPLSVFRLIVPVVAAIDDAPRVRFVLPCPDMITHETLRRLSQSAQVVASGRFGHRRGRVASKRPCVGFLAPALLFPAAAQPRQSTTVRGSSTLATRERLRGVARAGPRTTATI
jgi:hypothetical protein